MATENVPYWGYHHTIDHSLGVNTFAYTLSCWSNPSGLYPQNALGVSLNDVVLACATSALCANTDMAAGE